MRSAISIRCEPILVIRFQLVSPTQSPIFSHSSLSPRVCARSLGIIVSFIVCLLFFSLSLSDFRLQIEQKCNEISIHLCVYRRLNGNPSICARLLWLCGNLSSSQPNHPWIETMNRCIIRCYLLHFVVSLAFAFKAAATPVVFWARAEIFRQSLQSISLTISGSSSALLFDMASCDCMASIEGGQSSQQASITDRSTRPLPLLHRLESRMAKRKKARPAIGWPAFYASLQLLAKRKSTGDRNNYSTDSRTSFTTTSRPSPRASSNTPVISCVCVCAAIEENIIQRNGSRLRNKRAHVCDSRAGKNPLLFIHSQP